MQPQKITLTSLPEKDGKFTYFGCREKAEAAAAERKQPFYYYYPDSGVYLVAVAE